jgi:Fe-S-cluster containining protein
MMNCKPEEKKISDWDCFSFPCGDSCCQHGADVFAHERDHLISSGLASASDFSGPQTDEMGDVLYRTKTGTRGCVFLQDDRGCRLHMSGHKPSVCREWPRNFKEAKQAAGKNYLPCFSVRYAREISNGKKPR